MTFLLASLTLLVKALLVLFAVDFASGLTHWLEDSYGSAPRTPRPRRTVARAPQQASPATDTDARPLP